MDAGSTDDCARSTDPFCLSSLPGTGTDMVKWCISWDLSLWISQNNVFSPFLIERVCYSNNEVRSGFFQRVQPFGTGTAPPLDRQISPGFRSPSSPRSRRKSDCLPVAIAARQELNTSLFPVVGCNYSIRANRYLIAAIGILSVISSSGSLDRRTNPHLPSRKTA